jgi:hypothetical protein
MIQLGGGSIVQYFDKSWEHPLKLFRLIKMCLNGKYSKVSMGRHLYGFPIQDGQKQGDALLPLLFSFA